VAEPIDDNDVKDIPQTFSSDSPESADPADLATVPDTHPIGFRFFFWGELAERCSFYGMRAILMLFLTEQFKMTEAEGTRWLSYYKAAAYLLPLLGGFLADKLFGRYWIIVGFSVPYVIGQSLMGIENKDVLILALVLCACGSGVIKPNISSLMGETYDQLRPGKEQLRAKAFLWFYFAINVGSTISMFALPKVRTWYGPRTAFLIPAVLMAIALLIFAAGKRYYATEGSKKTTEKPTEPFLSRVRTLLPLFSVFGLMVFFWVAYEHQDNFWVSFTKENVDLSLPDWLGSGSFDPDQFQSVNAALILIMVPFFQWFWPKVDPNNTRFPATRKIFIGFLAATIAPALMTAAAYSAQGGGKISMMWIVAAYVFLTLGEVLIYGTGLEFSYAHAPADMKGFITACFLLTIFLGNLINAQTAFLYKKHLTPAEFYTMDTAIVFAAAVAFFFVGRNFNRSKANGRAEIGKP
jgi:POT family proton-dependent oligopeptide transporter